jgi:protein phosphatase
MQAAQNWSDCLEYIALSDVGMRRANNQDAHAEVLAPDTAAWLNRGHLFVVCDGMGAHAAGELASKIAADGIPHTYLKMRDQPAADAIRKSIEEVNNQIHLRGQANPDFQGMGTTASALVLLPQGALAAHVGDSRVYRLRGKRLDQLTFDHSLVWEMSAAGQVPKDALPGFVPKNIITRGSSFWPRAPAIGAVTIMKAPVTNMVSPICRES